MEMLKESIQFTPETYYKIIVTVVILIALVIIKHLANSVIRRRVTDTKDVYYWTRFVHYIYYFLLIIAVSIIWIRGLGSIGTFLGLIGAGLAIAMQDTITNMAGWFFIMWRKPFCLGDRIQIGDIKGDVIDIRLFQFSVVEIGNWVDAEQSTGRIVHIPNSKVLKENLANYQIGFDYIWHEIPVLVTFESNWKKAKEILETVASEKAEQLSEGAKEEIRRAAMKYLIYFKNLTPIVYTTVKDSGVMLTIRYVVRPRTKRGSEQEIWEAILDEFEKHDDIDLAYPTTRLYRFGEEKGDQE